MTRHDRKLGKAIRPLFESDNSYTFLTGVAYVFLFSNVTRFYKTDPNHTSDKVNLTIAMQQNQSY